MKGGIFVIEFVEKDSYNTGDKVPVGNYLCTDCPDENNQTVVMIGEDGHKLPECPCCGKSKWFKF